MNKQGYALSLGLITLMGAIYTGASSKRSRNNTTKKHKFGPSPLVSFNLQDLVKAAPYRPVTPAQKHPTQQTSNPTQSARSAQ